MMRVRQRRSAKAGGLWDAETVLGAGETLRPWSLSGGMFQGDIIPRQVTQGRGFDQVDRGTISLSRCASTPADGIYLHRTIATGGNQGMTRLDTEMRQVNGCHRIGRTHAKHSTVCHRQQRFPGFQNWQRAKHAFAIQGRIRGHWSAFRSFRTGNGIDSRMAVEGNTKIKVVA